MAAIGLGAGFPFRSPVIYCARQIHRNSTTTLVEALTEPLVLAKEGRRDASTFSSLLSQESECIDGPEWKKISSKDLGITNSMISKPTRSVLNGLKKKGYQVYLVGGCVRDLILKRPPKDFDIITSANLYQVMRTFSRSQIVGRRFPICHVYVSDSIIEVSSFKTSAKNSCGDLTYLYRKPPSCDDLDYMLWRNCLRRDFTINGLMFDPYSNMIYDYTGGLEDIKKAKVRTVIPAQTSFQEDCARILRAIRIAARLDFRFTKETAFSIKNFSHTVLRLDKARLQMETNYMLAYGSGEASLRLLWKLGLLEILLPIQAAYLVSQGFRRRDKRSNMLLSLFSNLDRLLAPNRPCHCSLWTGILAFHQALASKPQEPLVVAAFALSVHNGGNLPEAVAIAKKISHIYDTSLPELLEPKQLKTDCVLQEEVLDMASSVKAALSMMTDENYVSHAMAKYPQAPFSNLVLISLQVFLKVCDIFDCVRNQSKSRCTPKRGSKIDYDKLAEGDLAEVRHVFARVVFDTIYPLNLEESESIGDP